MKKEKRQTSLITDIIASLLILTIASTVLIAITVIWTSKLPGGRESFTPLILVAYVLLFALVIAIFGALILNRLIIRPLKNLLQATQEISKGNFNVQVPIDFQNEFGQLAQAFNQMAKELAEKQKNLEQKLKELEQTNEELRRTQNQLIVSEKMASVGKLAAGVAHEIGNPLSIINGYIEFLSRSKNLSDDEKEILRRVNEEVRRIHQIIKDLLDYSRPPTGALEPVDFNQLVNETLNLVKLQKGFDRIETKLELDETLPTILGNRNQLKQVLVNLLLNALDAMPNGGTLIIKTKSDNHNVVAEVIDTGIGIAPEHLNKIFDPFFTTKEPGKGTGLGLSISLKLIENMGGTIEVESELGKGSTFRIKLKPEGGESGRQN